MADDTNIDPHYKVDLAKCHFGDTFSNPCFWLLLGSVLGGAAVWWLMAKQRRES